MSPQEILSGIGAATTAIKTIAAFASVMKDAEAKNAVADLLVQMAHLKVQVAELIEDNLSLRQQIKSAEQPGLTFRNGFYFSENGDGPFCTGCYDKERKTARLTKLEGGIARLKQWQCPVCQMYYNNPSQ